MGVIFPRVCEVCGCALVDGEEIMCLGCNAAMPRTRFHLQDFNRLHQRLAGDTRVEKAASWFHYRRESVYSRLIHKAKYHDRPELARKLARLYARELQAANFFDDIDIILPVPMHRVKEWRRGYNQAREIAAGLSDISGVPVGDNLRATRGHRSQTRHGAYARYINVSGIFTVENPDELDGRHVLIVDDVATTGSTLLACAEKIRLYSPTARISVLTLASASML